MAQFLMQGVEYAQFLNDMGATVRHEVMQALNGPTTSPVDSVGGIELAQRITRLSKSRIYALVAARGILHSKRGNKLYFNYVDLIAWVNDGKRAERKTAAK